MLRLTSRAAAAATCAAGLPPCEQWRHHGRMDQIKQRVAIIGAGAAGLACARTLSATGADVTVVEASDRVGGRIATDKVDGFLIDRGFQVLLTTYPEIDRQLDRSALDLRPFERGALVHKGSRFIPVSDPFAKPASAGKMVFSGLIKPRDVPATLKLLRNARRSRSGSSSQTETTIAEALSAAGVSKSMLESFWTPFLAGITLEPGLSTSSKFLDFLLVNFSTGAAAVPARGMQAIPQQLAAKLPEGTVRTGCEVTAIEKGLVQLADGSTIAADHVVLATDGATAARLADELPVPATHSVGQISFDCGATPPHSRPVLVLDGDRTGPVNNLQVMSNAAAGYAPAGHSLATCSILEPHLGDSDELLERKVRAQLGGWYGKAVGSWKTIALNRVDQALPAQPVGSLEPLERPLRLRRWLWVAGDHRATSSIDGAMAAGRHAGEQIAATISEQA